MSDGSALSNFSLLRDQVLCYLINRYEMRRTVAAKALEDVLL